MSKPTLATILLAALCVAAPAAPQVDSKCVSSQLKASGAHAAAQTKCESKAAARGEAVDPECLAKAAEKAAKALAKAEGKEDCIVTGAPVADAVEDRVEEFVADVNQILNPTGICCAATEVCVYTADAAACTAPPFSGTPGAEGSVCTGDGSCSAPPAAAGNCCQDFSEGGLDFDCVNGIFDAGDCAGAGGTFSTAVCTPSGLCL